MGHLSRLSQGSVVRILSPYITNPKLPLKHWSRNKPASSRQIFFMERAKAAGVKEKEEEEEAGGPETFRACGFRLAMCVGGVFFFCVSWLMAYFYLGMTHRKPLKE